MNKALTALLLFVLAASCHSARQKANEVINKAGETAGESATELVKGVGSGIDKALGDDIDFTAIPKDIGLQTGKITISDSAGRSNILSVYFIFNKDVNKEVLVKVLDKTGLEYGRSRQLVSGKAGEARYIDFNFGGRTIFEAKSKFVFE
jgi:hypothetical protein